jgi:25S rRNA (adenine2142-N1)-methyltransferase
MGRKRKMFTTGVVPIGGPRLKSRREARKVTSQFHKLQNEIGEILNSTKDGDKETVSVTDAAVMSEDKQRQVEFLEQSIEAMGGRDRYQQASVVTTAHHSTSKWVVSGILLMLSIMKLLNSFCIQHSISISIS